MFVDFVDLFSRNRDTKCCLVAHDAADSSFPLKVTVFVGTGLIRLDASEQPEALW